MGSVPDYSGYSKQSMLSKILTTDLFSYRGIFTLWADLPDDSVVVRLSNSHKCRVFFFVLKNDAAVIFSSDDRTGFQTSLPFGSWRYAWYDTVGCIIVPELISDRINYFFSSYDQMLELKELIFSRMYPTFKLLQLNSHILPTLDLMGPYPRLLSELVQTYDYSRYAFIQAVSRSKDYCLRVRNSGGPLWVYERRVSLRISSIRYQCSQISITFLLLKKPLSDRELWELFVHGFYVQFEGLLLYKIVNQMQIGNASQQLVESLVRGESHFSTK